MKTITYYEVGDSYDVEGKGPFQVIARFFSKSEANKYAKGRGNYSSDASVSQKTIIIVDTAEQMEEYDREAKRQAALRKLTEEERELLGLDKS